MSELSDQLDKVIQQASLDGTLTRDAVDQFHEILAENSSLGEENDRLKDLNAAGSKDLRETKVKLEEHRSKVSDWVGREKELAEREKNITKLELTAENEKKRVQDHINMVGLVFRNIEVRREVLTAVPGAESNQYGAPSPGFVQRDKTSETQE